MGDALTSHHGEPIPNGPHLSSTHPGNAVVNGDFNRQASVVTHNDPNHPAVTVCISDREKETCKEIALTGEAAMALGRALSAGGYLVWNHEIALKAREAEEEA